MEAGVFLGGWVVKLVARPLETAIQTFLKNHKSATYLYEGVASTL
jgi:hypothetical protein